jgi:hypothetical protein
MFPRLTERTCGLALQETTGRQHSLSVFIRSFRILVEKQNKSEKRKTKIHPQITQSCYEILNLLLNRLLIKALYPLSYVIPVKAGIQSVLKTLDSRLRGNDSLGLFHTRLRLHLRESAKSADTIVSRFVCF